MSIDVYIFGGVTDAQSDRSTESPLCVEPLFHECDHDCTVIDVSVDKLWSARLLYFCNVQNEHDKFAAPLIDGDGKRESILKRARPC